VKALAAARGAVLATPGQATQPNELDLQRIVRLLQQRARYRYVQPLVDCCDGGYRIQSPCCSRNVDVEGGMIDIALLEYETVPACWALYRKDHAAGLWMPHARMPRLAEALDLLNHDPQRVFWR
jgi:hypothetical protein